MQKQIIKIFIMLGIFLFLGIAQASAADVYMSTTGTKSTGKSTPDDWSNANCYATLRAAFAAMSSGDTLTINDGSYSGTANTMDVYERPPSGPGTGSGDARFTIIKARNIPGQGSIPIASRLRVIFEDDFAIENFPDGNPAAYSRYIKWEGLRWNYRFETYSHWDHHYFKQCAFRGGVPDNVNQTPASMDGRYNLLEDVVTFGRGRYGVTFYDDSRESQSFGDMNSVCRRCITRLDWAEGNANSLNPIAGQVAYYARGIAFLNSMVIDSDLPNPYWNNTPGDGEIDSAWLQAVDNENGQNMLVQGSIAVNVAFPLFYAAGGDLTVLDSVGIKTAGGVKVNKGTINRVGLHDLGTNNFSYRSNQIAQIAYGGADVGFSIGSGAVVNTTNNIVSDVASRLYQGGEPTGTYSNNNFYNAGGSGSTGTNPIATSPFSNGWLYPVRIEAGSALKTGGTGGGQVGPNIMKKLGADGTFKGDANWNTEQGDLWPWPYEDWVKAEMASMESVINGATMPSATRGFCAPGQTLTKYIWESLGNPIPDEIYGASSDTTAPSAPGGLVVS